MRKLIVILCLITLTTAALGASAQSAQPFTNFDGLVFEYDAATYTVTEAAGTLSVFNNRTFQPFTIYLDSTAAGIVAASSAPQTIDEFVAGYNRVFGVAQTLDPSAAQIVPLAGGEAHVIPYTQGGLRGVVAFMLFDSGEIALLTAVTPMANDLPALTQETIDLISGMSYGGTPALSDPNAAPLVRLAAPITPAELPEGVGIIGDLVIFEYPSDFRITSEANQPLMNMMTLNAFPSGTNVVMTLGEASDLVNGQTWKTMFVSGLAMAANDTTYDPATSWTTLAGSLGTPGTAPAAGSLTGAAQQGMNQAQNSLNAAQNTLSQAGSLTGAAQQSMNQAQNALNAAQNTLSQAGSLTGAAQQDQPTTVVGAEYPVVEVYQALNPNGLSVLAYVVTLNADLYVTINTAAVNAAALEEQRPLLDEMALSLRLLTADDVETYDLNVE